MLTSVLLDYSCLLTPGISAWAAMGGDVEVMNWSQRSSPAGHHVQDGATARHALAVTRTASLARRLRD
jgi:hypothetical protein